MKPFRLHLAKRFTKKCPRKSTLLSRLFLRRVAHLIRKGRGGIKATRK
jgi:hypothetical protein|eukprot:COSAG01_NODE_3756_length_5726_cov_2.015994_2_plen_48_part_00